MSSSVNSMVEFPSNSNETVNTNPRLNNQPSSARGVVKPRQGVPTKKKLTYSVCIRNQSPTENGDAFVAVVGVPEGSEFNPLTSAIQIDSLRKKGFYVALIGEGFKAKKGSKQSSGMDRALVSAHTLVKQLIEQDNKPKTSFRKAERQVKWQSI